MNDLLSSSLSKSPGDEGVVKERSSKQWSPGEIAGNYLLRSLSLLFSVLPRDLVFEVFGWLTPRELIKLVEVNRELRHLLMSQESKSIWKSARERNWTLVPDSLSCMTELEWARLIFSGGCKRCGYKSNTIIWEARIRLCYPCWRLLSAPPDELDALLAFVSRNRLNIREVANTPSAVYSDKRVRNLSHVKASDLVPFSLAWSEPHSLLIRVYLPDLNQAKRKVTEYQSRIASGNPGAEEEFEAYISDCETRNIEIKRHAILCESKYPSLTSVESAEQQAGKVRLHRFLLEVGHREKDIKMALETPGIDFTIGLTKAAFIANQEKLEHAVRAKKAENVLVERKELARSIYIELCEARNIKRHHLAPPPEDFLQWSLVSSILNRDTDAVVTKDDFLDLRSHFMDFVDGWTSQKILMIRKRVKGDVPDSLAEDPKGEKLLRATSVFRCRLHNGPNKVCLVWIDGSFMQHMSDSRGVPYFERLECLERRERDAWVVANLIQATGQDPDTTSVDQMDMEGARFFCRGCFLGPRISRTWRRCVIHHIEHHSIKRFRGWERLNAQETNWSIHREFYRWPSQPYSCLHCDEFLHLSTDKSWGDLLAHLSESHSCHVPVKQVDYQVDLDPTVHPPPVNMGDNGILDYVSRRIMFCRHCMDDRGKSKAFTPEGVASHVKAVHSISTVGPDDYIEVS